MPKMDAGRTVEKWESGGVTLYRGDALELLYRIPGEAVTCIVTDPPYGHNNNNGDLIHHREAALGRGPVQSSRPIANDGKEANDLFRSILPGLYRVVAPGGNICCCCCGGGGPDPQFARWSLWLDEVFDFKHMVVWDKGPIGMGWHYRRSYETVLVATRPNPDGPERWYDTSHKIENVIRPGAYGIRKIIPRADQHPTEKPFRLAEFFLRLHTQEGDTVLDPFMGHGWSGVAAVRLGRKYIGMELDPKHYAVAQARIARAQKLGSVGLKEKWR